MIALLSVLFLGSSCKRKGPELEQAAPKEAAPEVVTPADAIVVDKLSIVGTWTSGCIKNEFGQINTFKSTNVYNENTFVINQDAGVTETDCTLDPSIKVLYEGTYVIGEALEDGFQIDMEFTKVTWTLTEAAVPAFFNDNALCGITNWETGVAQDVLSSTSCLKSKKVYDIVKIVGDKIGFGEPAGENDAMSPEGRPDKFSIEANFATKAGAAAPAAEDAAEGQDI